MLDYFLNKFNQNEGYDYAIETNNLANQLYANAGNIASAIDADTREIWAREDSAYQRMVEDMKKAGLNPWAGISSGGLATSVENPSMNSLTGLIQVLGGMLDTENAFTKSSNNLYTHVERVFQILLGNVAKLFS